MFITFTMTFRMNRRSHSVHKLSVKKWMLWPVEALATFQTRKSEKSRIMPGIGPTCKALWHYAVYKY